MYVVVSGEYACATALEEAIPSHRANLMGDTMFSGFPNLSYTIPTSTENTHTHTHLVLVLVYHCPLGHVALLLEGARSALLLLLLWSYFL